MSAVQKKSSERRSVGVRPRHLGRDVPEPLGESIGSNVCVPIGERGTGPENTVSGRRPDPKECAALWKGEPPPFDEIGHRRMKDVNKELADDLRGRVSIKIGRMTIRTL